MVRCLDGDDVGAEIRPQQKAESLDDVGSLWLPSGQTELRELLVGLQHHKVRAKHHASRLLFVVVDLDGSVVGHAERDDPRLVSLEAGSGSSCVFQR